MTSIWFLEDRARLVRERAAVNELATSSRWLIGTSWILDGGLLCIDAVIRAHGNDYHVRLEYPTHFPSVPPTVRPTNAEFRWTTHQYGDIDGPLCLEWGPDNWLGEVTGAQMLESAYNLFQLENPLGTGRAERAEPAPSRHSLTLGQELRASVSRFYIRQSLLDYLASLPKGMAGTIQFSTHSRSNTFFALIHAVEMPGAPTAQIDDAIPHFMCGPEGEKSLSPGAFFKTTLEPDVIRGFRVIFDLKAALWKLGHDVSVFAEEVGPNPLGLTARPFGVLVVDKDNSPHFFFLLNDQKVVKAAFVLPKPSPQTRRQPEGLEGLSSKLVGIVGLGSAGSRIAVALARMGVRLFYLVDYDIFLPENIERHVLDWSSVGAHKVDGMRELLSHIRADIEVDVSTVHLTGQESSAVVSGTLRRLSECDIVIDATANTDVFNLLAAVTTAAQKPLVWLEVFGGGTGGLIARSRPDRDPVPQIMRDAYNHYCEEHPSPDEAVVSDYATENREGQIMVGSDADVGIIANHAARFMVDTVLGCDPSTYPYSMYLVGLAQWWVFSAPFHTIPIDTHRFPRHYEKVSLSPADDQKALQFIIDLLNKQTDATPSSS